MRDLPIPPGTLTALRGYSAWTAPRARKVISPVVAAELRCLADEFRFFTEVGAQAPNQSGVRMLKAAQDKLHARANELDGGES